MSSFALVRRPWDIDELSLSAQTAHDADLDARSGRKMRVFVPTAPAVVLGSTQPDEFVDREAAAMRGIDVARRRSGGGAVLVDHSVVWADFSIARDDPLWLDDIGHSMQWVGELWCAALQRVGIDASVHRDRPVVSPLARAICFCGVGHGEVLVDGRKAVGISQRRTRNGARFQTVLMTRRDDALIDVLRLDDRAAARAAYVAAVFETDRAVRSLIDALIEQLSA